MRTTPLRRLVLLAGLLLAGQGLLVVTRILDHEMPPVVGWGALVLGAGLVALAPPPADAARRAAPPLRRALLAGLGLALVALVAAWNLARGSGLAGPEIALVAYGVGLVVAAPLLGRAIVDRGVAYSFALVLGPLAAWGVEAALASSGTEPRLALRYGLVEPMAWALGVLGLHATTLGETIRLATPRGSLFLTVGMVCSGLYATVLFLGVFGLFAWEARTPPRRLAAYLALGVAGLYVANLLRLVLLGYVGYQWGGAALQRVHAHAGWALFVAWGLLFWWLVLRRFEGQAAQAPRATG